MVFEFIDNNGMAKAFRGFNRVLKNGGTLFLVTTHPLKMVSGRIEDYNKRFWTETSSPWGTSIPNYHRPLCDFIDGVINAGFTIDSVSELQIPEEARNEDTEKYEKYSKYGVLRLAIRAHK